MDRFDAERMEKQKASAVLFQKFMPKVLPKVLPKFLPKFLPIARPYGIYPAFGRKMEKYALGPDRLSDTAQTDDGDLPDYFSTINFRYKNLEVRLARSSHDVRRAQRLRYQVFYEEMNATASAKMIRTRRDADEFDPICDHFIVLDHGSGQNKFSKPKLVGTYRVLRQEIANHFGDFYSQSEYDLKPLLARHPDLNFCELGRSCVLAAYRDKRTVDLLWKGIWAYVILHKIDVLIGVASLQGTNIATHKQTLSFLHHNYRAPKSWRVSAHPDLYTEMNLIAPDEIDTRDAMRALPPLIKGYLRVGAFIGDGAFIDTQFDTTDVLIIQPTAKIAGRYAKYFSTRTGVSR